MLSNNLSENEFNYYEYYFRDLTFKEKINNKKNDNEIKDNIITDKRNNIMRIINEVLDSYNSCNLKRISYVHFSDKKYLYRYLNFDIEKLPFMEIAKLIKVKVRKSNKSRNNGQYFPDIHTITISTDYESVFIHELAHAIDWNLPDFNYKSFNYHEWIAELTRIVLCEIHKIKYFKANSLFYLKEHFDNFVNDNMERIINRVIILCNYVNKNLS